MKPGFLVPTASDIRYEQEGEQMLELFTDLPRPYVRLIA